MQGNCTAQPTGALDPPRKSNTQCVLTVREDFLEAVIDGTHLWISDLYVKLPGLEKGHSTLIGVHGGDVYLTDMTFVGDRDKARAIDVLSARNVYVASVPPSQPTTRQAEPCFLLVYYAAEYATSSESARRILFSKHDHE